MRVAVIGAGPAGLTAAYQLAKEGVPVEVFEAGPGVGGLARSFDLWNQRVDLGPHRFFSSDARVNRLWLEVVGRDYRIVDRLTRIYYRRRLFNYPLKIGNVLANLGLLESARCVLSVLRQQVAPVPEDGTFESWVVRRFGWRLYQIFFEAYSEKVWGIGGRELDSDFAAQRIKSLSLLGALKNAFLGGLGNTHRTLVDQFAYPMGGTGMVYERMARQVESRGGAVHLRTPVRRVRLEGSRVTGIETAEGHAFDCEHVVSTMPLTLMVKGLEGVPPHVVEACDALTFRNTVLVYLNVDHAGLFPDNWLYIHSRELEVGRITNFRNWIPELYGEERTSIVSLEYWCSDEDPIWGEDEAALADRARRELEASGLLRGAPILDARVIKIRRCYPVYRRGYKEHVEVVRRYLDGIEGLQVIGRYGAFKYNNQDHSILMGLLAADNVVRSAANDLWGVNTDYESYQERALITETGLVPAL